jgi:hypothetical protein
MPIPPYTITFQPSSSGTALVSRVFVSRPSGASGVHEGSYDFGSQDIPALGDWTRYLFKGITNTPCLDGTSTRDNQHPIRSHMHPPKVPLTRDAQVAPLRHDLPQRLVIGSSPINSTLTTHPRHTPRSPQVRYPVLPSYRHLVPYPLMLSLHQASHHRYNA